MEGDGATYEGYCLKDKANQEFVVVEYTRWSNGTPVAKGKCPECGASLNRVLDKATAEALGIPA